MGDEMDPFDISATTEAFKRGLTGLGPMRFAPFLRLGVPCFVGGNASVGGKPSPPSGLTTCEVASQQLVINLVKTCFAASTASCSSI